MGEDVEHKVILTHYLYQKPQKYINMLSRKLTINNILVTIS